MAITSFVQAYRIILDRFVAQWAILHPSDVPLALPNVAFDIDTDFDPDTHTGFVRANVLSSSTRQASISFQTKRWRSAGVFIAQIFVPQGSGIIPSVGLADDVKTAMQGITTNGLALRATSPPINVGRADGLYQQNTQTPFLYDVITTS